MPSDHEIMLNSRKQMFKAGGFKDKVKEIEKEEKKNKGEVQESRRKGGEEVFAKLQLIGAKNKIHKLENEAKKLHHKPQLAEKRLKEAKELRKKHKL